MEGYRYDRVDGQGPNREIPREEIAQRHGHTALVMILKRMDGFADGAFENIGTRR
jgi:hypothetical protein